MFLTRLSNLLCVKSIVTILLTLVFGYLTITNRVSGQDFLTIFSVVIAFYLERKVNGSMTMTPPPKGNRSLGLAALILLRGRKLI